MSAQKLIPIQEPPAVLGWQAASWRWLLAAPHRLLFFIGQVTLLLASLWWAAQLSGRVWGWAMPAAVSPSAMHGWLFALAALPFFMFGFLFTAGPRMLQVVAPATKEVLWPTLISAVGVLLAWVGAMSAAALTLAGVLLVWLSWLPLLWRLVAMLKQSRVPSKLHMGLATAFFWLGWLAQGGFAGSLWAGSANGLHGALMWAVWCFLIPIFLTVAHRLFPFFIGSVLPQLPLWQPRWLLIALVSIVLAHGLLPLGSVYADPLGFGWLRLTVAAAGAALLLILVWRWGIIPARRHRLEVMLPIGLLWLAMSLALSAAALGWRMSEGSAALGLAPLHAATAGFMGTLLFAMVTRVTAGHSGRPLVADDMDWSLFWVLQLAAVLRVLSEVWVSQMVPLQALSAVLWCVAFVPWAIRKMFIYLVPRPDGQPG